MPDSTKLPEGVISFITRNPLMHEVVPSVRAHPLLVSGPERAAFTQIAVSPKVSYRTVSVFCSNNISAADSIFLEAPKLMMQMNAA